MAPTNVNLLTFSEAKTVSVELMKNIREFVHSMNVLMNGSGYDVLESHLDQMINAVNNASGKFLPNQDCDNFLNEFLITFTHIHPKLDQNVQSFFNAYVEIANFFVANPNAGNFQLANYAAERIEQMVKINEASNVILPALKKNPCDIIPLYASFAIHSSKTEISEYGILEELQKYVEIMKTNSTTPTFDPVEVFSITGKIEQRNGSFGTEARTIRNMFDHHNYDLILQGGSYEIHFKSKAVKSDGTPLYEKIFTVSEFFEYLSLLDLFYKTIVNVLFCYQLTAVLRTHFVV